MRELTEGTLLAGRYSLRERIGAGGMAELWLAHDARSDATVALKFLSGELADSARQREHFHNEWRLASRLMHAHIVRVFEYHDDAAGPYYALQFIDGPSIAVLSGQPLDQLLRPVALLLDALRYAHGKNIVHNDLTAANVRLDSRGAPYLLDFGIARAAGDAASGAGTPIAQSPQQRAGEAAAPADDIYSFAVLLHELLFNRPPDGAGIPAETSAAEPLPTALSNLLTQMLATDRSLRPDAEQAAAALRAAGFPAGLAVLPEESRPVTAQDAEIAVHSVSHSRRAQAAASAVTTPTRGGIPAAVVAGGLAVLVAALFAVLYLLPVAVEHDGSTTSTAVPGEELPAADEATGEQPSAGSADADDFVSRESGQQNESLPFSENRGASGGSTAEQLKAATDEALGDLLSRLERLRYRGIERWGGEGYNEALEAYAAGDKAYLAKDYRAARSNYLAATAMLDPFFDRIDAVFRDTMTSAGRAFAAQDHREAIRLYDLAVAITPGNPDAERGLERARNLETVLGLTARGRTFESNLEYAAARQAYDSALALDPLWQPAREGLDRVRAALEQLGFEQRMTEGFTALAAGNFDIARAAFETAKAMRPNSPQPADGLLQLDQALRLKRIQSLEATALRQEQGEEWEAAVDTYTEALEVDGDLQFAKDGLQRASYRANLHRRLQGYIEAPDSLSAPQTMQSATQLLLELSRVTPAGPRLDDQKETLARLLKRAATPLTVEFRSDNATEVSVYRVGTLGKFAQRQLNLRPGNYVVIGSRPGYRDVRLEFRVAPEIEMTPIVVQCEEAI